MSIFLKVMGFICFLLLSAAYFLWIYNQFGFNLKPSILCGWGLCFGTYVFCSYILAQMFGLID
jgi:hypothetical protein